MRGLMIFVQGGLLIFALALSFVAGRWSTAAVAPTNVLIQATPNDPRELIPLPGPGQQPVPGQVPGDGECPVYLYQDGQLFQLQPGWPGTQPGPGGGSPELFPLQPVPGPRQPAPPRFDPNNFAGRAPKAALFALNGN